MTCRDDFFEFAVLFNQSYFLMLIMKKYDTEVRWLWMKTIFNNCFAVVLDSWVMNDDVVRFLSNVCAIDT